MWRKFKKKEEVGAERQEEGQCCEALGYIKAL